jgi:hypothetical protein
LATAAAGWALVLLLGPVLLQSVADERPAIVVTQLPLGTAAETGGPRAEGMRRADWGDGARIVLRAPDGSIRVLTEGFAGAADPDVSRDGRHVLFAGKREARDHWAIFELDLSEPATPARRVVGIDGTDCRSPLYLSTFYTITEASPWLQIGFVADATGHADEVGTAPATALYTCKPDGSFLHRITFNLSSDFDPFLMDDGRLLYASWHRATLDDGPLGRVAIESVNVDGIDRGPFVPRTAFAIQHMPSVSTHGLAVFVESNAPLPWDGAGALGSVRLRRPLHSYAALTDGSAGLFAWPSPLPDGSLLVSRREAGVGSQHGLYRFDPETKGLEPVLDDPSYHELQGRAVWVRPAADGRSSVVNEDDPTARLYGLDVHTTDRPEADLPRGTIRSIRVVEGGPSPGDPTDSDPRSPLAPRRILAELPVEADGSFQVVVPANTPIQLQALDADGLTVRTCGWIWARSHQAQGCIGCHEDPERTPPNRYVDALGKPAVKAHPPADERVAVDFVHDMAPILGAGSDPKAAYTGLLTTGEVRPGSSRTSPIVWRLFGRNTSRPWDATEARNAAVPPPGAQPLTDTERRTLIRWIDLGASWDVPRASSAAAESVPR